MAAVTDLADATAAGTAGYVYTRYSTVSQGQRTWVTRISKYINPPSYPALEFMGVGASLVDQATADAVALTALNANRRHRYGHHPGRASGASDSMPTPNRDETLVVDVS